MTFIEQWEGLAVLCWTWGNSIPFHCSNPEDRTEIWERKVTAGGSRAGDASMPDKVHVQLWDAPNSCTALQHQEFQVSNDIHPKQGAQPIWPLTLLPSCFQQRVAPSSVSANKNLCSSHKNTTQLQLHLLRIWLQGLNTALCLFVAKAPYFSLTEWFN